MIRTARVEDAAAIADLLVELGYPGTTADDARRRLTQMLADAGHAIFVTEELSGVIHVCITDTLEHERRAEIRTLVVSETHRSTGVGARLVEAAERWAREHGLKKMRVRSNVKRERARRFYERLGYVVTKSQNVFDKPL